MKTKTIWFAALYLMLGTWVFASTEDAVRREIETLIGNMVDVPGRSFKMCKYECTQALWEAIMGENPSEFKGPNLPVECVSRNDCQEFLEKLNANPKVKESGFVFRLPTEEEWEYACRAGNTKDFCKLGDGSEITKETLGNVAWYDDNSDGKTHLVGLKLPNAFGLYDMHGNVWEWTSTAVDFRLVNRGGSWLCNSDYCACGYRYWISPDSRCNFLGFRLSSFGGNSSNGKNVEPTGLGSSENPLPPKAELGSSRKSLPSKAELGSSGKSLPSKAELGSSGKSLPPKAGKGRRGSNRGGPGH